MASRKLQEFEEYRYGPRSVLCPGDQFRVSGGPVYENGDGTRTLMGERGAFVFVRYCVKGAQKWLEAQRMGGGTVVLWVGKAGPNPDLPSYKRRPYKVRKVTGRARKGGKKQEGGPAADAVCAAKQRVGKGKDAGHKAKATGQAAATTGRARGAKSGPKPRAKAGSTPARRGGAAKRGKNGVGGGLGRGRGSPSTSGSTSI